MPSPTAHPPLIDLTTTLPDGPLRRAATPLLRLLESILGIPTLNHIHSQASARCTSTGCTFWRACVEVMGLRLDVPPPDLLRLPPSGPAVIVANHPYGAAEAILLMDLLRSLRPDVKVLANGLLCHMPCAAPDIIPVDVEETRASARRNAHAAKTALAWLKQGGLLLIFPSGTVSHLHLRSLTVTDPAWNPGACALALKAAAPVIPIHIAGRNRWSFHLAGLLHPRLRTLLLIREMTSHLHRPISARIGQPVPPSRLRRFPSPQAATEFIRIQCYAQQGRPRHNPASPPRPTPTPQPLAPPLPPDLVHQEIESLPPRATLVREGSWSVLAVSAPQIPCASREIARLREETFRLAGEGTGLPADWDRFDAHYTHLILWDHAAARIAGGYRLGRADWILDEHGLRGLYTRSLFRYPARFIRSLGHALELGRSFIHPDYQKQVLPLSLLWRGIGEWITRHPRYHTLFGPVSISGDYLEISRSLMVQFLKSRAFLGHPALRVRAPRPPRRPWLPGLGLDPAAARLTSIDDVSALVASVEDDGKGVPVLLRHYLKLNARLLAFNIDPAFSNALDALVVVDLRRSDPRLLQRFMSPSSWQTFARFHQLPTHPSPLRHPADS